MPPRSTSTHFAAAFAFDADHLDAGLAGLVGHVAGQGAGLAVGVGGGDDHPVEQGGQAGGVDDANVPPLMSSRAETTRVSKCWMSIDSEVELMRGNMVNRRREQIAQALAGGAAGADVGGGDGQRRHRRAPVPGRRCAQGVGSGLAAVHSFRRAAARGAAQAVTRAGWRRPGGREVEEKLGPAPPGGQARKSVDRLAAAPGPPGPRFSAQALEAEDGVAGLRPLTSAGSTSKAGCRRRRGGPSPAGGRRRRRAWPGGAAG